MEPAQSKTSNVAKQAGAMGFATLLSRFGGLIREQVFAFLFGASDVADAFNIAFRIPNLLRDLFAEGAMSAAFVPQFTRALGDSKDKAFRLLMAVLWTLFTSLTLLSIIGIILSPQLVGLYASGFKNLFWKFDLTVALTQVMFPFFPLVAMAAVTMGALNAMGFFFIPAFAPVMFNIASILSGVIVCPLLERFTSIHPIYGMAWGVVIGGFLQFYVQWHKVRKEGFSFKEHWLGADWKNPLKIPGVRAVLVLIIPGTVGLAATQLNILINSMFATSKGSGAVSWLNYAFRLMQFPIGIFGVSLAAATLPQVVRALNVSHESAGAEVRKSLRLCFAVNFAASAGLIGVGLPLIQILFQHGHFRFYDSLQTAQALLWYSVGLTGYSVVKILVPVFYALNNTKIPVISSFVMVAINALVNYLFLFVFNYPFWALALATSITSTLNAVILFYWLNKMLPGLLTRDLLKALGQYFLLGLSVYFVCFAVKLSLDLTVLFLMRTQIPILSKIFTQLWIVWTAKVGMSVVVAVALWLALGKYFKLSEMDQAFSILDKKVLTKIRKRNG